jgi:CCR4-NOT transcription complex subunit 1
MCARDSQQVPEKWLEALLGEESSSRPVCSNMNRFAVAAAALEAADDLITRQRYVGSAMAALSTLSGSRFVASCTPVIHQQCKLMTQGESLFPPDVEAEATTFFKKIYSDDTANPVAIVDKLHGSGAARDQQLLNCIVSILVDEIRSLAPYPWKSLQIAATLLGYLINSNIMPPPKVQEAVKLLLPILMKQSDPKSFEYAIIVLDAIKQRLGEWPLLAKQIRNAPDIDLRIPGIVATINLALKPTDRPAEDNASSKPSLPASVPAQTSGFHYLNIDTLVAGQAAVTAPPQIVQDKINFLVGNTDPNNIDNSAEELRGLLSTEFFPYFAEYLVVKRVSLESNFHRMYLSLLEKLQSKSLEARVRHATVAAIHRLLSSSRIKHDGNERSLLKNLGSWLGCITLAKNIPVLSRDINFRSLLMHGLQEGILSAVVPFMAKVLEHCASSRFFRPRNPWTMAQLVHLLEVYCLPDLRLNLRFEVEVLLGHVTVSIEELGKYATVGGFGVPYEKSMQKVRDRLNLTGSADFYEDESARPPAAAPVSIGPFGKKVSPAPASKGSGLNPGVAPYLPKSALSATVLPAEPLIAPPPPRPAVVLSEHTVRPGDEIKYISASRHQSYRLALCKTLEPALQDASPHVDRAAIIAAYSAREIVIKDFQRDADVLTMKSAGLAMARSLASNLCCAVVKEPLAASIRKHAVALAHHLNEAASTRAEIIESIFQNNFELCVRVLENRAADNAAQRLEGMLQQFGEEKLNMLRKGDVLPIPPEPSSLQPLLLGLPEALRPPSSLLRIHRAVYEEFHHCVPVVEQMLVILRSVQDSAVKHYENPSAETLSLTQADFTEEFGEHHLNIRARLVEIAQLVNRETVLPIVGCVFSKLVELTESLSRADERSQRFMKPIALLLEVYLFVIQSTNEKGKDLVVQELTRLYLQHENKWRFPDLAVSFIRLRVLDIALFDAALSKALQENPSNRSHVDFASQVLQRVLLADKLTTTKDLTATLGELNKIANARQGRPAQATQQPPTASQTSAAVPAVPSPASTAKAAQQPPQVVAPSPAPLPAATAKHPMGTQPTTLRVAAMYENGIQRIRLKSKYTQDRRGDIEKLLNEWLAICQRRALVATDTNELHTLSRQYVKNLQTAGYLVSERHEMETFIGTCMELAVEHYATTALTLERNEPPVEKTAAAGKAQPPPYRYPAVPELFVKADALSDLVLLLVRCCSWTGKPESNDKAEAHLILYILQSITKCLTHNHDAIANNVEAPELPTGEAYQAVFQQQPYVRVISNLIFSHHKNHPIDDAGGSSDDILRCFVDILRATAPMPLPGFAFGWLELVGHRLLLPRIMRTTSMWGPYVSLLCEGLRFMDYFVRDGTLPHNASVFAKAFVKLALILLHDFPDFVLSNHTALCDATPVPCVQLRNIILCAFPRTIKLPDPFAPSMQLDKLAEMSLAPPITESYTRVMDTGGIPVNDLAECVALPANGKASTFVKSVLFPRLRGQQTSWNIPLINAVTLHIAVSYLSSMHTELVRST